MSLISNTFTISIAASPTPQWFLNLSEKTWTDIAGGNSYNGAAWQKGSTISDVQPNPSAPGSTSVSSITSNYMGAVVLQSSGEYLKIAEGGHNDYYGNEIYALRLRDETPGWKRIWGPTPNAQIITTNYAYNAPYAANADNTPRSAHGWYNRVATDGPQGERLWTFLTNANGNGAPTSDVWSIPRANLGVGTYNPSLWIYHGRWFPDYVDQSTTPMQSFPTCWDSVGNQIFVVPEADVRPSPGPGMWAKFINIATCVAAGAQSTSGPQIPGTTTYSASPGNPLGDFSQAWTVVSTNTSPRCLIARRSGQVSVWNLESPNGWRNKTLTGTGTLPAKGAANAYYNATNKKIVLGGSGSSTLQIITVPDDPWNTSTWTITPMTPVGGSITGVQGSTSESNTKFQVINDMGNGQACVVMHVRSITSPVYVYKLPVIF